MSKDALRQDAFPRDAVDRIIEDWAEQRPDLDTRAKAVTGRVIRLAALYEQTFAGSYRALGLDNAGYGILAALRRAGDAPITPTELARRRMMTSGGMTAALDRLERGGLVERLPNPADRRGSLVRLTAEGRTTIDEAVELQGEAERRLLAPLARTEVDQLVGLLRRLLLEVDPDGS